jgi:DNA-binding GntR family transcriptional regulator
MYTLVSVTLSIKSTADHVADALRAEIESGAMPPGSPLNQVAIAKRFGLSRIPVREALRQLEAQGYVTYRANKGAAVITALPPAEVLEILEIRECLELRLMELAARNFARNDAERAEAALQAMNRAADEDVVGVHAGFHAALYAPAQRPRMAAMIDEWRFGLHVAPRQNAARKRAYIRQTRGLHQRLLNACVRRDVKAALACVREEYALLRATLN